MLLDPYQCIDGIIIRQKFILSDYKFFSGLPP